MLFVGFPCGSAGKESACIVGELGSIPVSWLVPAHKSSAPCCVAEAIHVAAFDWGLTLGVCKVPPILQGLTLFHSLTSDPSGSLTLFHSLV